MNTIRHALYPTISWSGRDADSAAKTGVFTASPDDVPFLNAPGPTRKRLPNTHLRKRILLVDDDDQVLTSVALVLEEEHYDVIMAGDGYEAMIKCQSYHPDLVLVDLNMPRLDGWQTIEVIGRLEPLVPIIVITARPQQYRRAMGAGVDAFMEKPLDFPVLLEAMERLLQESPNEHLGRITSREFKTAWLGSEGGRA